MADPGPSEEQSLAAMMDAPAAPGTEYRYGSDEAQLWEEFGDADAPVAVLVHGGYFRPAIDRGHLRATAAALAGAGYRTILAEYRRIPADPLATIADLRALEGALVARDTVPSVWIGHSAGGSLVMQRAFDPGREPVPVVALAPVGDLRASDRAGASDHAVRAWIGAPPEQAPHLWDELDPAVLLSPQRAEQVTVLHGDRDLSVALEINRPFRTDVLEGAHHFDVVDPSSLYWPRVLEAVNSAVHRS